MKFNQVCFSAEGQSKEQMLQPAPISQSFSSLKNNTMKPLNIKLFLLAMLATSAAFGQKTKSNIDHVSYSEVKNYLPKPADAEKIAIKPAQENINTQKPDIKYSNKIYLVKDAPFKTPLKVPKVTIPPAPIPDLYLKGGFGNYASVYGEAIYNTVRDRNNLLSVDLLHNSGKGPLSNSGFSNNGLDIFGKKIFDTKYVFDGGFDYHRLANRYYGVPDSFKTPDATTAQVFNDIKIGVGFSNHAISDTSFKFRVGLDYNHFSDNFKTSESDLTVSATASEPYMKNKILFDGTFDYIGYGAKTSITRTLTKINAHYRFDYTSVRLLAGIKTANESSGSSNAFHFYPDLIAEADIYEKQWIVFGYLTGDLEKNTFRSMAYENPFIQSGVKVLNPNRKLDIGGGLKGSIDNLTYNATLKYQFYKNQYFYINDSLDAKKFSPAYDTGIVNVINLHGELGYNVAEDFNISTKLDYYHYTMSTLRDPFHRPPFVWTLASRYSVGHKFSFGMDLFMWGSRKSEVIENNKLYPYTLKPVFDLNANAVYTLSNLKGVSVFVDLKNILGTKYNIYNFYPTRGFQVMGGVIINLNVAHK